jgi:hypothetical protein
MREKFGLEKEFSKALIKAYYKEVRKEIAEINTTRIDLKGLGSFDLKYFKVKYRLRDTINFIAYHEKARTNRAIAILITLERKLVVLKRAKKLSEERETKDREKRLARKEYVAKNHKSLDKPEQDSGGD